MAKRGPKPTPSALLRSRGSLRGNRPDEPQSALTRLQPPAWLNPVATEIFGQLAEVVFELGVSIKADQLTLALLAESIIIYQRATAELIADGVSATTKTGNKKGSPALTARSIAWSEIVRASSMFGLNPSDRTRAVRAGEPSLDDDALADAGAELMRQILAKQQKGTKRAKRRPA